MGAVFIYEIGVGETPEVAFRKLKKEALHEYGYGAYSGTIATCYEPVKAPPFYHKITDKNGNVKNVQGTMHYVPLCMMENNSLAICRPELLEDSVRKDVSYFDNKRKSKKPITDSVVVNEILNSYLHKYYIENLEKRDCYYIDLGVDHYEVTTSIPKKLPRSKGIKKKFALCIPREDYGVYSGQYHILKVLDTMSEAMDFFEKECSKGAENLFVKEILYDTEKRKEYDGMVVISDTEIKVFDKKPNKLPKNTVKCKAIHKYAFYGWAAE